MAKDVHCEACGDPISQAMAEANDGFCRECLDEIEEDDDSEGSDDEV